MKKRIQGLFCLLMAALLLAGCSMQTVDEMYKLPKRSKDYSNLQSAIDQAMNGLVFSAPIAGDNQQSVQMADLDGDDKLEYLVFSKGSSEMPLRVLIFDRVDGKFVHIDTIQSSGASFDQVEYIQMDKTPGVEVVIGCQVSNQLTRSASVYTFAEGAANLLLTTNYQKYVTVDLDGDSHSELFVLRPNQGNIEAVAELYSINNGVMERTNEVSTACPADKLKRILVGKLQDGKTAVYVASTVGDTSLVTDVFTLNGGNLTNVVASNEFQTSVETLRSYFVYADDMDNDGVVELPRLETMIPLVSGTETERSDLISWYSISSNGTVTDKLYTFYDAAGGWYLKLDDNLAKRITVRRLANIFEFHLWNEDYTQADKLMTIYTLTGSNRNEQSLIDGRILLHKTETVTYLATIEPAGAAYEITQESLVNDFYLIQRDWNTGEM